MKSASTNKFFFSPKRLFLFIFVAFFSSYYSIAQVNADFKADTTSGCNSLTVTFTDLSTGGATSWNWDFDGSTSTAQNPTATFTTTKNYTIKLTASNASSSDTETKTDYIKLGDEPAADYSSSIKTGCSPLTVSFTDLTTIGSSAIKSYIWDFGDGSPAATVQNPTHTFKTNGKYPVALQVNDDYGCGSSVIVDIIDVTEAPKAEFSSFNQADTCGSPYTVDFQNLSTGSALTYLWDFGDGSPTSTLENPSHQFTKLGRYDITLITSDPNCKDTVLKKQFVKLDSTVAKFKVLSNVMCITDTTFFINNSEGATSYLWNFGDGNVSSLKTPKHVYEKAGKYEIKLSAFVSGSGCFDQIIDSIEIQEVIAKISIIDTFACKQKKEVTYVDASLNGKYLSWYPDKPIDSIPDNSQYVSRANDSTHIEEFLLNKLKLITLIAKNELGCADTISLLDTVYVPSFNTNILHTENDSVVQWDSAWLGPPVPEPTKQEIKDFGPNNIYGGCLPFGIEFLGVFKGLYGPHPNNKINPVSWKWDLGNGETSSLQNPPAMDYSKKIIHYLTLEVVDDSGCVHTAKAKVFGGTPQKADFLKFNPTDSVCYFDTTYMLSLSTDTNTINKSSFSLLKGEYVVPNLVDSFGRSYSTEYGDTGTFAIRHIVVDNGCPDTALAEKQLFVSGPIIRQLNYYSESCEDLKTINFSSDVLDDTGFEWDFGDGSAVDNTNPRPTHVYANDSNYVVYFKAWNDLNNCDTVFDRLFISTREPLPLSIFPENKNLCFDDEDSIGIGEANNYNFSSTLVWKINGDSITRGDSFKYVFKSRGIYEIEVISTDSFSCSSYLKDTFYVSKPIAKIGSNLLEPCVPMEVEFFDDSESDTTIAEWFWTFGNMDTSFLEVDTTTYKDAGKKNVFFRLENEFGCADSIFVKDFLEAKALRASFAVNDSSHCVGDSVTFINLTTGVNPSFEWDFGDGNTSSSNTKFVGNRYAKSGIYTVTLVSKDENGCVITLPKADLIGVDDYPVADFTSDTAVADCNFLEVDFTDESIGNITKWEWILGDGSNSIFENPERNYTQIGEFDVFLKVTTQFGCTNSILKPKFIQLKGPQADIIIGESEACVNELISFELVNLKGVESFFWNFGNGDTLTGNPVQYAFKKSGSYKIAAVLSDSNGCIVSEKDSLTLLDVYADFSLDVDSGCVPFDVQFDNRSVGENSILWRFPNGDTSTSESLMRSYSQAGDYLVALSITSDVGCFDTAYQRITALPPLNTITTPDTGVCLGDSILLTASGAYIYKWQPLDFLTLIAPNIGFSNPDSTIEYVVFSENRIGCKDIDSIEVFVPRPPIKKPLADSTIIVGETIAIDVSAGERYNYQWTPEEWLSCPNCPNPIAQPIRTQTYIVKISDDFGCYSISDTINIEVLEMYSLDVPKAFSPNGDGINDVIFPRGWGLKELVSFKVYNRFGEIVFESTDFNRGWDGTYREQPQNMETYIYTVEALTFGERTLTKKGNFSLIR